MQLEQKIPEKHNALKNLEISKLPVLSILHKFLKHFNAKNHIYLNAIA